MFSQSVDYHETHPKQYFVINIHVLGQGIEFAPSLNVPPITFNLPTDLFNQLRDLLSTFLFSFILDLTVPVASMTIATMSRVDHLNWDTMIVVVVTIEMAVVQTGGHSHLGGVHTHMQQCSSFLRAESSAGFQKLLRMIAIDGFTVVE